MGVGENGGRVRTDTITVSIQAFPYLGGADDVEYGWIAGIFDAEGCNREEIGVSDV